MNEGIVLAKVDEQLINDIYALRPDIKTFALHEGHDKNTMESLICSTFAKIWYLEVNDIGQVIEWRDKQYDCELSLDSTKAGKIGREVRQLVFSMFGE